MHHIALVDDDRNILTSVSMALEEEGFKTSTYTDGEAALKAFEEKMPDLIILDIKMPRIDGMEVLRQLREKSLVPVIFLTSKDEEIDELCGLRMGADDYIRKPFSQHLLTARIKALFRRKDFLNKDKNQDKSKKNEDVVVRGDLKLDKNRHLCFWNDKEMSLTITEFLLLLALVEHPGHVKTRDQLIDVAYGQNTYVDDRTIDSHIKRLRRKFKELDPDFSRIEAMYGAGYRYRAE